MRNAHLSLAVASLVALSLVGCSSADAGSAVSSDSAYTSDRAPTTGGVTPFTDADAPPSYEARVRVSFDGAATQEAEMIASVDSWHADKPLAYALGIGASAGGAYYVYFGPAGSKLAVGTYSCADGDALVLEAKWNADGHVAETKVASSCTFVIDELNAVPGTSNLRAYGRFQAAKVQGGLPSDVVGAFVADIPLPVPGVVQHP